MKVLLTSDHNPTTVNGVIVSVLVLKRELEERGCDVRLLTLSPSLKSYKEDGIYYVGSVPLGIYPDLRASGDRYNRLIDELIDWCPDIIHSQCEFFTYSFVQRIARHCHAPIVHTYHTQYEYYTRYVLPGNWDALLARVMRMRLETADVVIAPTDKTRQYLRREKIGRDVRVIPTGIDLDSFSKPLSEDTLRAMRRAVGVPDAWHLYGTVGRVAREKNLPEVLEAHRRLREERQDVGLLIVGDGAAMEETRALTQSLGIGESVFFTGMVEKAEVGSYYRLLSFFLSASVSETQGLTYIEALSNGRPVVARRDLAIDHVVIDGENGYQFDTTEECVDRMRALVEDAALLARLQEGAYASRDQFGGALFGERVYDLYQEVLRREGKTAAKQSSLRYRVIQHIQHSSENSDMMRLRTEIKGHIRRRAYDRAANQRRKNWLIELLRREKKS